MKESKKKPPSTLRKLWHGWKKIAREIGNFQARVLLVVFYFLVLTPFAIIVRIVADPLGIKRHSGEHRGWHDKQDQQEAGATPLERALRQA